MSQHPNKAHPWSRRPRNLTSYYPELLRMTATHTANKIYTQPLTKYSRMRMMGTPDSSPRTLVSTKLQ
uniref:Uncharacterized protein n=1 Tax=Timema poppense TaxID=170557 RepID=A0A7R9DF95_TIMPO|nr:unnamed protein product [Timema poppensis]